MDVLTTIIIIVAACAAVYAGWNLYKIYRQYKIGVDEYKELQELAESERVTNGMDDSKTSNKTLGDEFGDVSLDLAEQETEIVFEEMENPIDFDSLLAINKDVIGWLEMGAIGISYPVAQAEDNDFYLHQTIQKTYNFAGSIFMECLNSPNFGDRNSILYGHNMQNGSMFGMLSRYRDQAVYDKDPTFWIYTPDFIYQYEIFACSEVELSNDCYQISFLSKDSFEKFIEKMVAQSAVKYGVPVESTDMVLTLSTCTGNSATRCIVQGKRVRTYKAVKKLDTAETAGTEEASGN